MSSWNKEKVNNYVREHRGVKSIDELINKKKDNVHHLLPQTTGGSSQPENLLITEKDHFHPNFHGVFGVMTFKEIILTLLDMFKFALSLDVINNLLNCVKPNEPDYYYRKECILDEDKAKLSLQRIAETKRQYKHIMV